MNLKEIINTKTKLQKNVTPTTIHTAAKDNKG